MADGISRDSFILIMEKHENLSFGVSKYDKKFELMKNEIVN